MVKQLLVIAAVLFLLMLVVRFARGLLLGRRLSRDRAWTPGERYDADLRRLVEDAAPGGARAREVLRRIESRAMSMDDPAVRAAHHCAAAGISLAVLKRPGVAAGLYMRAMRDDPTCLEALIQLEEILLTQKRHRALEGFCWNLLGRLGDGATGTAVWHRAWSALAALYAANPRRTSRADAIRRMLAAAPAEAGAGRDDDETDDPAEDASPPG